MVIFSKILSKTDIKRRCAVPMKYFKMKGFPKPKFEGNHQMDFVVKDEDGHDWILCCSIRRIGKDPNHPKHPKPALIKGWIKFARSKKLRERDRVTIYEEQDETGFMRLRIRVEKQTSPSEARWSPVMTNNDNESTATFQCFGDLSADVLSRDQGGTTAATTSSIHNEQKPTPDSTSQDIACHKTVRPSLSLSLDLPLKPTMTGGMTAATSSSVDKEHTPTFHCTFQDIACSKTEPSLSLSLGLTLTPTMTGQHHAYMQETEPKTRDFLRSFS